MQVKKFLCLFLAALLLTASCAVAEVASPVGITLESDTLQLENCLNAAGDKYIIKGKGQPGWTVMLKITDYDDPENPPAERTESPVKEGIVYSTGDWEVEIPVLGTDGKDFFAILGNRAECHVLATYRQPNGVDTQTWCVGKVIRMSDDKVRDVYAKGNKAAQGEGEKYYVPTPEFGWKVSSVKVMIQLRNDDKPFANQNVTLCIKNATHPYVPGKTDAEGCVTFELHQSMQEPGKELVVLYNNMEITSFTVPEKPVTEMVLPPAEVPDSSENVPTPGPAAAPTPTEKVLDTTQLEDAQPNTLLGGMPIWLVYILCALFLGGYGVCWFLGKNPQKSRGKGV